MLLYDFVQISLRSIILVLSAPPPFARQKALRKKKTSPIVRESSFSFFYQALFCRIIRAHKSIAIFHQLHPPSALLTMTNKAENTISRSVTVDSSILFFSPHVPKKESVLVSSFAQNIWSCSLMSSS